MQEAAYKNMDEYANRHFWYVGREKILLSLIDVMMNDSVERILDYGCGNGELLNSLNEVYSKKEIYGADISEKALNYCMSRGLLNVFDLNSDQPKNNYYDLILCCDVLEHIPDDFGFLKRLNDLLREGGKILITVPAYDFLWSGEDYVSNHYRRYTMKSLKNKISKTGFRIDKISYYNIFLFFPVVLVLITKRIFRPKTMYISDIENVNSYMNNILTWIFASERWLLKSMSFPFGASIITIAKKI